MLQVIWRELSKVRVEAKTAYGSDNPADMAGQYLLVTLQAHRLMYDLLRTQFCQHPEVAPHIMLYLFEHITPLVEMSALKQIVESQPKNINKTEKTCKELRTKVDSLTEKTNRLIKK